MNEQEIYENRVVVKRGYSCPFCGDCFDKIHDVYSWISEQDRYTLDKHALLQKLCDRCKVEFNICQNKILEAAIRETRSK